MSHKQLLEDINADTGEKLVSISSVLKLIDDECADIKSYIPTASLIESSRLEGCLATLTDLRKRVESLVP